MKFVVVLCCFLATPLLRAGLLSEALHTFPANTVSLEYDDLKSLRRLPNYAELRRQYSSASLGRLKDALLQLGLSEDQVSAVVTASGPAGFFGLLAGPFNMTAVRREAARRNLAQTMLGQSAVFCSRDNVCVAFGANSDEAAFFGTMAQLNAMLDARQNRAPALASVPLVSTLFAAMDTGAPLLGFSPGSEIGQLIGADTEKQLARFNLLQWFSRIQTFGYSMRIDAKAHVAIHFLCDSETQSSMLCKTLNLAGGLEDTMGSSLPFENLLATPSGRMVALTLNAKLGS